jgi:hypothetical protein
MKGKKNLLLFLALLMPVLIFVMLKMFGKNQFDVTPLFVESVPQDLGCNTANIALPYRLPDSVIAKLPFESDSLICLYFDKGSEDANEQVQRAVDEFKSDPVTITSSNAMTHPSWRRCIFFLEEPFDLVLVDRKGAIRGQYVASDRDEMDRLITEITILLKKY